MHGMRRFFGGLFILLGLVVVPPALFMEGDLGDVMPFIGLALFIVGIVLMARRPSAEEIAERMVQKDVVGSIFVLGGLITVVAAAVVVWRFVL